jgi:alcohol dehydrogenase (cytochrome c)
MLYDTLIDGQLRKVVQPISAAMDSSLLDRLTGKFIKAAQYVNDLNWTKGLNPKTGMPP